jgi:ATP-dependent phosphofructokinase / diphosphate-dependent phosphofructokinase
MKTSIKKIAVLTSGGDCPGLNSVLRAVVTRAEHYNWEVCGIYNGLDGFIDAKEPRYRPLSTKDLNFYETRIGSSILCCSNQSVSPFDYDIRDGDKIILHAGKENVISKYEAAVKKLGIDAVIMTGGDGSMTLGYHLFKELGLNVIGIPKTIDNDTPLTKFSVGFSSSVESCVEAMDSLIPTARGHQKWMVLEVMGKFAGHIAAHAGIAGGADVILIPEIPFTIEKIVEKIKEVKKTEDREYGLIVVAEGAIHKDFNAKKDLSISKFLLNKLKEAGIDARNLVLGHIQRGCRPNAFDRFLGTAFGTRAVDLLAQNKPYQMVAYTDTGITNFDLIEVARAITKNVDVNSEEIKAAINMNIYVGEK